MFGPNFNLFCLAIFLCIFLCAGNSNMKSCVETEKQALLKLKAGFIDDWGILSSWKSEVGCCQWNGISCNNLTGHVTKLHVPTNHSVYLRGNIDPSLCDLQHLTHLNLSFNNFEGNEIPKCIGSLQQLREFIISYASLGGTIPHELRNLSNLQTLDLRNNNYLIANDLEWISNLSSLTYLDLSWVNLSQAIDWQSSLSRKALCQLRNLVLSGASLVGIISHELVGNLSSLQTLNLGYNSGLVANDLEWISNLSSLTHLDLSYVNLSQAVDWQLSLSRKAPSQLINLVLSGASLVGIISHELGNLSNLQTLDLGYNHGLIVNDLEWISRFSSLRFLSLSWINLSRVIDWQSSLSHIITSLFELRLEGCALHEVNLKSFIQNNNYSTSLKVLDLAYNHLNTSILYWASHVGKALVYLDLSGNPLHDIGSKAFANMTSLKTLWLMSTSLQHVAADAFINITSLESLILYENNLDSDVVKSISNLCQLKNLLLSSNNLSGQLSDWIPQLFCAQYNIETLELIENSFNSGPFPDFSKFSSLVSLDLQNTSLYGPIPQSLGRLPHLSTLDISFNNLSGPLPKFEFPSLKELYLSHNKLNGVVNEVHLSTLSNLKVLDISSNFISFNFSSKWEPPFQLQRFFAASCKFGIDFPMWLKYQRELEMLEISDGAIADSIPPWFWRSSFSYLNISHNKIYGELPKSLKNIKSIVFPGSYIWDLSFNNLSGSLPHFPQHARALILSNNMFTGSISPFCATLHDGLTYLDMSSNQLSGKLPDCWKQFPSLKVLLLANNDFLGTIPNSIGALKNIETIHLNDNNLSGKIPSLVNSSYLQFIDFGQNNLHGELPTWIGHSLPSLIVLRLHANKFHGSIPTSLCNLSLLQILDLSHNNITGIVPQCLNNLSVLSNTTFPRKTISYDIYGFSIDEFSRDALFIENAMLNWKGRYVEYDKNLGLMATIDLSCNHLTGEIPSTITSLKALASLNLSRNNLTGFIPNNMGKMKMLESLDLSCNSLSGGIPISFSALTFLSFLNLSFNNLSGEIPQTTQLQTFNASSYIGNLGLCGQPLTKGCPRDDDLDSNSKSNPNVDANEDELITFGFYISMSFGFIIGFWGVCGALILKSSWRQDYFQFFNNMCNWIYVRAIIFRTRIKMRSQD